MMGLPWWYFAGLWGLCLIGGALTAWLLLLKCPKALGFATLALAATAHAQVQSAAVCTNRNCSSKAMCAVYSGLKWDASEIDCSACPGGSAPATCTTCGTANAAATLTGSISGTQVTSCPLACGTASSGGGSSPLTDQGVLLVSPKPFEVQSPDGGPDETATALVQHGMERQMWAGRDGTLYQGGFAGRPLNRQRALRAGERFNANNGDVYEVTAAGMTAVDQPVTCPVVRLPAQDLRANQRVYPGWGGGSVPGAVFRVTNPGPCTTARKSAVTWCPTNGCTTTDGTCTMVREALGALTFTDGTATLKLGWIDPYGGVEIAQMGQSVPNGPTFAGQVSDNQDGIVTITQPQMRVDRYMESNAVVGTNWRVTLGAGDARAGTAEHEFRPESGGPHALRVTAGGELEPPDVPPVVTLVAGGSFSVGQQLAWSVAYLDKRWDLPTAVGTRAAYVTPTAGMQAVRVCFPALADYNGWPQPGGSDGKNRTRVLIYAGERTWWTTFVGILESPDECLTLKGQQDIQENQTGAAVDRNGFPLFEVADPNVMRNPWAPNMGNIQRTRTHVRPPIDNGHDYIAVAVGCIAPCTGCNFDVATRGTTGSTAPAPAVWDSGNRVPDGDVCWMRLPLDNSTTFVMGQTCFAEVGTNGPRIGLCIGPRGITRYDTTKDNPLNNPLAMAH